MITSLSIALPEFVLFLGAMGLLMLGVQADHERRGAVNFGAIALLLLASLLTVLQPSDVLFAFNGAFVSDDFSRFAKVLIFLSSAVALFISYGFLEREGLNRFEYPVLVILSATGMGMMVSSADLISLYMGIELQSLALYVVAAINRDSQRASEAGLKYFVLGALSSGLLLYGCSLIYGATGSTSFAQINSFISTGEAALSPLLVVGFVFLIAGLAFKVSAVPFHMWTPDVYEGAPTPVTAFFAAAPKIAGMAIFVRFLLMAAPEAQAAWQQIIIFISAASMVLGAFAAIGQHNIKRMMAYSSIGHMGFALLGLAAGTLEGAASIAIYLGLYLVMTLGAFACILAMRRDAGMVERIDELAGLSQTRPFMAACLAILMFSLAGIPPMAGFFGKFYVFRAAIDAELYALSILGVLASVVGAYYYLRIVKIMYLDAAPEEPMERMTRDLAITAGIMAAVAVLFVIFPSVLVNNAQDAARGLFEAAAYTGLLVIEIKP